MWISGQVNRSYSDAGAPGPAWASERTRSTHNRR
jgi:hypothetical protein